ncbi:outer membrane protein [Mariniblastus fucicola]|uniref:Outer membrane protein beta-barrel domain-containing protein n=2 Tax=Mariniblastus fucicola TaxID=980251 RepID=A0A5B9P727_9BACT|nr:outer membrane beta-barrel protein [Mariniblastus fucicola]QEG22417.1 hypothetical protein MFFC18_22970 [Mariniblastus fucicola]
MYSKLICFLFVAVTLQSCVSQVEAQVTYALGDTPITSGARNVGPVRRAAQRVRSGSARVVPTFDKNGRFNREAAYSFNESRPLAGLFAPDFELTASVFGGWNRIVGLGPDSADDGNFDDDLAVGFAYGRRHNKRLRSEFEFTYRSNEASADVIGASMPQPLLGEVQVYSIMKNFVIDIEVPSQFATPYVGIGIGYAHFDADFNRSSGVVLENSSSFAWQPIGGVSLQLTERAFYYIEYRYFSTTELEVTQFGSDVEGVTYSAHNLFMGLRFEF